MPWRLLVRGRLVSPVSMYTKLSSPRSLVAVSRMRVGMPNHELTIELSLTSRTYEARNAERGDGGG